MWVEPSLPQARRQERGCGEKEGHSCLTHFSRPLFPFRKDAAHRCGGLFTDCAPRAPCQDPQLCLGTELVLGGARLALSASPEGDTCQLTTASVSSTAAPSPPKSRVLEDGGRGAQSEGWEYSPCRLEDVLTEAQT